VAKNQCNLIGSVLPAVVPGLGLYNLVMGKAANTISAFKDANKAWNSALQAMQSDTTNYGVSPNAMGPTTAAQAQALADALASQLSSNLSSGDSGGYTSDQAGGGWGGNDSGYSDGVGGVY
jgi:hypothetical protein